MVFITLKNRVRYNPKLKGNAKNLRRAMTETEKQLWYHYLQEKSNTICRVYRQRPIDEYIVDFYVPKLHLVIEVDGDSHFTLEGELYDKARTHALERLWLRIIRFTNRDIINTFEWVCLTLENEFEKAPPQSPS